MSNEPKVGYRTVDGLQIRYADSDGSASQYLVLTSPWPESLHAFDRMWPRLSGIARLLAIDLPGFGRSERRTDLLSPMAMSEFLIRILDEWDIRDPYLVCPDVGTPAALFAAASHPGRIRSLVVGGGATAYPLEVDGVLKELIEAPDIDAFRSQDPRALIQGLMATLGPDAPDGDIVADYVESNMGDRFAEAARYVRSYPDQLSLLAGLLPKIFTPVQIITGRNDPLVPVANAEFLHTRLPNSRIDVLDAGHLAWEEASGEYGAIIAAWVNGGYLAGSTGMGRT
ncbi:MAG TPA: alpha/beta hydrolase [Streptosporangiaceae bacterium]|nr:alpha/beta hydrolase [Streptosporangiaceae bacterium]